MQRTIEGLNWPMAERVFEMMTKVLFVVLTMLVAVIAYQGRQVLVSINDHEVRITRIESNRYTPENARDDLVTQRTEMKEFIALNIKPMQDTLSEIKEAVKENRDARLKQ